MKTIGITIDDYKQEKFEEALGFAGFSFTTTRIQKTTLLIRIMVTPDEFDQRLQEIAKICKTQQVNFNHSN